MKTLHLFIPECDEPLEKQIATALKKAFCKEVSVSVTAIDEDFVFLGLCKILLCKEGRKVGFGCAVMENGDCWVHLTGENIDQFMEDPNLSKLTAAVEMGRLGGPKGGKIRMEKLTAGERSELGRKGAFARWKEKRS